MENKQKTLPTISFSTLVVMIITAIITIRALATEAEYGLSSAFFYLLVAVIFFIPSALAVAELTMMFPRSEGGVFSWVSKAMGTRLGFVAIWMQWVSSMICFPALLILASVSIAYVGTNMSVDALLASNKIYTFCVIQVLYWIATYIAMNGMRWISVVSKVGGLVGTIIPVGMLIACAVLYLILGGGNNMSFNHGFFPTIDSIDTLVLAACIISFYGGIEIISVHVKDVPTPERTFPRAFLLATVAIIAIYILGTFAISIIVPMKDISLTQSVLMEFDRYFHYFKIPWMLVIIAIALAIGVFAETLVWISSPSKGIFAVGKAGFLPPYFQRSNKKGLPKNILLTQGYVFSAMSLLFLVMPTVQSFYQIVCQLAVILHLAMYVLLFISIVVLRYKEPNLARPFRIGKRGNAGA